MRKIYFFLFLLFISTNSWSQPISKYSITPYFNMIDYADSVHFEYMGYRRSVGIYQNTIPQILDIINNSYYSLLDRRELLERMYVSQYHFADALNYTKNPWGITANDFNSHELDESLNNSKNMITNLGIGVLPTDCEGGEYYFSPNTLFFYNYAVVLNDSVLIDYLEIKKIEDRYYYPKTDKYRCEGGASVNKIYLFIRAYEDFLNKHIDSRFVSSVWSRYSEASTIFLSSSIFYTPHGRIEDIYVDILSAYKDYLNRYPEGYLKTIVQKNIKVLEENSELLLYKGKYEEKRRFFLFQFPNL